GEGLDLKRLTRLIDLLPNEKYREVMEWIASGNPLTKLAQIKGCAKQTLFSRRDYARNELKSLYTDCQTIDWQRNVLNKSIIQICKDSGMSRMEVCYLLRVLDYANEKTNIIPEPVEDVQTKEREAVAECVLSAYDFQGYKDAYSRYGDNYESAPKVIREDYKNICLVVELARKYMRAVFDSKEGGTRYWKLNGINLGSLRKSDLVFFTRLHSYVMFDTERPYAPCKLKERLIEKLSDMQEVGGEMD
ncbi:MAG: hypothetical protein J6J23_07070, partial [Clostridia bacterium]|nr:hypothetical protein [Clostridia bacterium]